MMITAPETAVTMIGGVGVVLVLAVSQATEMVDELSGWTELGAFTIVIGLLVWFMRAFLSSERAHREQEREALSKAFESLAQRQAQALEGLASERQQDREYRLELRDRVLATLESQTVELARLAALVDKIESRVE